MVFCATILRPNVFQLSLIKTFQGSQGSFTRVSGRRCGPGGIDGISKVLREGFLEFLGGFKRISASLWEGFGIQDGFR